MHEIDAERGIRQGMPESIPLWVFLLIRPHTPAASHPAEEHNDGWTIEHHDWLQHRGCIAKRFVRDIDLDQEVNPYCCQSQNEAPENPFSMAQHKRSYLLQVHCCQSSQDKKELVGQQKAILIGCHNLPHS